MTFLKFQRIPEGSPAFIETVLKAYRMSKTGATMPRGKISIDERVPRQPNSARTDSTGYQEKSEAEKTLRGISGKSRVAIYWIRENDGNHYKKEAEKLFAEIEMLS